MSVEPTYPDDAAVGAAASGSPPSEPAPEAGETDKAQDTKRTRQIVTGAAIGVGSAALVAALLYANRSRGAKKDDKS